MLNQLSGPRSPESKQRLRGHLREDDFRLLLKGTVFGVLNQEEMALTSSKSRYNDPMYHLLIQEVSASVCIWRDMIGPYNCNNVLSGVCMCEAIFLVFPSPQFPNYPRVTSVNVLVSPSNYLCLSPLA